ncbi:MAG: glycoside hydrolase family 13 protein [Spirochaetes bacterium]|uniref:Glycoside hydrolase family 13 protein n=1 Tax=Candidatus Ornithospirochaeta stercoravium TaxID=2840897 RepID=A0A9D9IBY2_9SPIO|nr:glycoside hydrolase family 13 protein [Candidatus Ornithospirochaeta stercoravium]
MSSIKAFSSVSIDFISPIFPKRGEECSFAIIFSSSPDAVFLRTDSDSGTGSSVKMEEKGHYNGAVRFEAKASVTSSDDIFHYYFAFIHRGKSWYYGRRGITRYVPSIKERFSIIPSLDAPAWVEGSVCYQIFPDRFFCGDPSVGAKEGEYEFDGGLVTTPSFDSAPRSFSEARCLDFYNGDLRGIEMKLPYLKSLGVDTLYLNPINDSRTVHRYDAVDFFHVDPKLGGDEAFIHLMKAAHECGIRIIVDISINHTGIEAEWFRKALSDPDSVERGFYIFQEDGAVKYWQGVKTLPQLNYLSDELRDRVYRNEDSAMQKYLKEPFMQDGWRLDVAPEVGRCGSVQLTKEVWREVRKALKGIRKDLYLVGEDWDDSSEYMEGDMWDATMNYYGVSRPLRSWMGERDRFLTAGWGHDPDHEESWTGQEITEALRNGIAAVPDQSAYFQMNLIDSHDTPRLHNNKAVFRKNVYIGCVIAAFMLPGMPSIYYGDENLIDGEMGSVEASRYPMCWDESKWDADTHEAYKKMGELRKLPFIPYSSVRIDPIDNEAFSVARFTRNNAALAVINRCPRERHVSVDLFGLPSESAVLWYGNGSLSLKDSFLEVELPAEDSIVVLLSGGALPKA